VGLSGSAYKYAEPLQIRFAPLIEKADGYANKAVDIVESRYPYPFQAKPEDVAGYVRQRRQSASEYVRERRDSVVNAASKTLDERVKSPAITVAQGIDQKFAPIVDYFEERLNTHPSESKPPAESKYQYQRAYALSKSLTDQVYIYSNEHLKQIQAQSVLLQRATSTAHSISELASSSLSSAQSKVHALSDTMLQELQKLQASTAALTASFTNNLHNSTSQLQARIPPQVLQTYTELSTGLSSAVVDFRGILAKDELTLQDKAAQIGSEVRERVSPLLESLKKALSGASDASAPAPAAPSPAPTINGVNGHGHTTE